MESGLEWGVAKFYKQIYTFHFVHVFNIVYFLGKYVSCQAAWKAQTNATYEYADADADAVWHRTKSKFIKNSIIKNT